MCVAIGSSARMSTGSTKPKSETSIQHSRRATSKRLTKRQPERSNAQSLSRLATNGRLHEHGQHSGSQAPEPGQEALAAHHAFIPRAARAGEEARRRQHMAAVVRDANRRSSQHSQLPNQLRRYVRIIAVCLVRRSDSEPNHECSRSHRVRYHATLSAAQYHQVEPVGGEFTCQGCYVSTTAISDAARATSDPVL